MRTCFSMDPTTIDPRKNGDLITSSFLFMLYDGLTHLLPSGDVELALAESYDLSDDGLTYTFRLKKAFWTDGRPITAWDFEYSWKSILDPSFSAPCKQLFFPILNAENASEGKTPIDQVGIKAIDDTTFRVDLNHPMPYFLSLVSFCSFYPIPRHIEMNPMRNSFSIPSQVTSGAFRLGHWERGKEILVHKNHLYWDAKNTSLSSILINIINDEFTTMDLFENDELDWVSSILSAISPSSLRKYSEDEKLSLIPIAGTVFCAFNTEQFPFNNENIRKAFANAIDRKFIVDHVTQLKEIPASRLIPPVLDTGILPVEFDPKSASLFLKKGLTELRIIKEEDADFDADDLKVRLFLNHLSLSYSNDDGKSYRILAHALQKQWSQVLGFRIKLISQPFKIHMQQIGKGDFNIALRICAAQLADPLNILERFKDKHLGKNFPKYESTAYSDLLNRSLQIQDVNERNQLLRRAESLLLNDCPLSPLYHINYPALSKSTVSGIEVTPIGSAHFRKAKMGAQITPRVQSEVC